MKDSLVLYALHIMRYNLARSTIFTHESGVFSIQASTSIHKGQALLETYMSHLTLEPGSNAQR